LKSHEESSVILREDDYLEKEAEKTCQKILRLDREILFFNYSTFQFLHKAIQWRVLQRMLRSRGSEETWEEGDESEVSRVHRILVHPPSSVVVELSSGLYLEKRYDRVSLGRGKVKPTPPFEVELRMPGRTLIEEIGKEVMVEEITWNGDLEGLRGSPDTAVLAYHHVQLPLKLRNFRPGDRFHPLGVRGTQNLTLFFLDHTIPQVERPRIAILISGEAIAWVVGYRIDERFKITEKIQRAIRIEVV
jgi:tRNA(Ile)-lysidine synthase